MDTHQPNCDIFDSTLNLEETHHTQGYNQDYSHGISTDNQEFIDLGLSNKGFVEGEELGFYKGCVDVWSSIIKLNPTRFSNKLQNNVKQMDELIKQYPFEKDHDDDQTSRNVAVIDNLRLKFRMIRASLRLPIANKLEYDGYPKPIHTEF
ncbi:hypothetical protein ACFE04_017669 [Oxalis oulophora]